MIRNYRQFLEILKELKEVLLKGEELSDKAKTFIERQESVMKINDENYSKLLRYRVMIEDYMMWKSRKSYFEIMTSFLNNKIDGNNFCSQIKALRCQNMNEAEEVEANLKSKTDFHLTSESIDFSDVIDTFNSLIDIFESDLDDSESSNYGLSENGLRSAIKEMIILKFSKYYDTN